MLQLGTCREEGWQSVVSGNNSLKDLPVTWLPKKNLFRAWTFTVIHLTCNLGIERTSNLPSYMSDQSLQYFFVKYPWTLSKWFMFFTRCGSRVLKHARQKVKLTKDKKLRNIQISPFIVKKVTKDFRWF